MYFLVAHILSEGTPQVRGIYILLLVQGRRQWGGLREWRLFDNNFCPLPRPCCLEIAERPRINLRAAQKSVLLPSREQPSLDNLTFQMRLVQQQVCPEGRNEQRQVLSHRRGREVQTLTMDRCGERTHKTLGMVRQHTGVARQATLLEQPFDIFVPFVVEVIHSRYRRHHFGTGVPIWVACWKRRRTNHGCGRQNNALLVVVVTAVVVAAVPGAVHLEGGGL